MDPTAGEAPERILATVPTGDLAVSLVLRSETLMLLLASVIVVVGVVASEGVTGLPLFLLKQSLLCINQSLYFRCRFPSRRAGFTDALNH